MRHINGQRCYEGILGLQGLFCKKFACPLPQYRNPNVEILVSKSVEVWSQYKCWDTAAWRRVTWYCVFLVPKAEVDWSSRKWRTDNLRPRLDDIVWYCQTSKMEHLTCYKWQIVLKSHHFDWETSEKHSGSPHAPGMTSAPGTTVHGWCSAVQLHSCLHAKFWFAWSLQYVIARG